VLSRLVHQIIKQLEVTSDTFLEFNSVNTNEEQFDEYFNTKRDLGGVIKKLVKLIGPSDVAQIITPYLQFTLQ
jgi:hypothetical protein